MAVERTLILVKGDAVARGLVGEIIARYERRGYTILGTKMMQVSQEQARQHYAEHTEKPFFGELVRNITSSVLVAMVLEGENAIEACRATNGVTDPIKATPGTIRGDYGQTLARNLVHASDSPQAGEREVAIFFRDDELFPRPHPLAAWMKE